MDWIDMIFWVWLRCGILAILVGLAFDVYRGRIHHHIFFTLIMFVIVCLFLGPIALGITIHLWLRY